MERIERNVLKWFGHVVRMGEERLVKRVHRVNVEGNRGRVRSQKRWRDEVKDLLLGRGLSEREGMTLVRDRNSWAGVVHKVEGRFEHISFRSSLSSLSSWFNGSTLGDCLLFPCREYGG